MSSLMAQIDRKRSEGASPVETTDAGQAARLLCILCSNEQIYPEVVGSNLVIVVDAHRFEIPISAIQRYDR